MAKINFNDGDKGGKGKSLEVRRMILENCWLKQLTAERVKIDKPSPDETVS